MNIINKELKEIYEKLKNLSIEGFIYEEMNINFNKFFDIKDENLLLFSDIFNKDELKIFSELYENFYSDNLILDR